MGDKILPSQRTQLGRGCIHHIRFGVDVNRGQNRLWFHRNVCQHILLDDCVIVDSISGLDDVCGVRELDDVAVCRWLVRVCAWDCQCADRHADPAVEQ